MQAQIIRLLRGVTQARGASVMLITHDMGVIAETCDRVAVMYAGRIVEIGPVDEVIHHPAHPYTAGLMASVPSLADAGGRLAQIHGALPRLGEIPAGCAFHPRCPKASPRCGDERPELALVQRTRAACWWPIVESAPAHDGRRRRRAERPATAATVVVEARALAKTFVLHTPWTDRLLRRDTRRGRSAPSTT